MFKTKKKIYKSAIYGAVGLTLVGSSLLVNTSINSQITKHTVQEKSSVTSLSPSPKQTNTTFKIRSNPTNGFSGLTTADRKYTYVLITKGNDVAPDQVGGTNSGIACIDTQTGQSVGEWYLPQWNDLELNYTTNIVFNQKTNEMGKNVFDETQIFVLCGISNLAKAISSVYDNYKSEITPETANSKPHQSVIFKPKINQGPTIKIFKLKVTLDGNKAVYTNALGKNDFGVDKFYNFIYPSDGTNGYAGFNANGVPYDMQAFRSYQRIFPDQSKWENSPGYVSEDIDRSMYVLPLMLDNSKTSFKINRVSPAWRNGPSFSYAQGENSSLLGLVAFSSYLTYLTYGQNFAYHLGNKYQKNTLYDQKDEFIMTTSFVNVDQNIGGLYSALVANNGAVNKPNLPIGSNVEEQVNLPVPFGYQWLLADIANTNKQKAINETKTPGSQTSIQYSYIDANGNKKDVFWGSDLALTAPFINFLNDSIFPLESAVNNDAYFTANAVGSLYDALRNSQWFGANWGATTGYIIYNPSAPTLLGEQNKFDPKKNEYRFYAIGAIAIRPSNEANSRICYQTTKPPKASEIEAKQILGLFSYSAFIFTNLLVTDTLAPDASLSYLIGITYTPTDSKFVQEANKLNDSKSMLIDPASTLFTNLYTTMFCYDWESISNDDKENALIESLAEIIPDQTNLGGAYINELYYILNLPSGSGWDAFHRVPDDSVADAKALVPSGSNTNFVFLGGASSFSIDQMDSSFTVSPDSLSDNQLDFIFNTMQAAGQDLLNEQLTFLRRKLAFVVHPYNGFVYFTAGTSVSWLPGLSFWDVRSFDSAELTHNQKNTGTTYLDTTYLNESNEEQTFVKAFQNPNLPVLDIKEINQPYGNGGPELAFITADGIYTAAGAKTDAYHRLPKDFYLSSVNNLLVECGTGLDNDKLGLHYNKDLISAIAFTPFVSEAVTNVANYVGVTPNVMVLNDNYLSVVNASKQEIYQAQDNLDYLILANDKVPGVLHDATNIPNNLQQISAAKPLLKVSDYAIDGSDIHPHLEDPTNPGEKLTLQQVLNASLTNLFTDILGLKLNNPTYLIDTSYDPSQFGPLVFDGPKDGVSSGDAVDKAKILIPVTYPLWSGYDQVVYYAPIKTVNNTSSFYELTGLQSKAFVQVLVILKSEEIMRDYLKVNKLTASTLYQRYGKNYNSALADEFDSNFVDTNDTDAYIHQHFDFFGEHFVYWVKPEVSLVDKTQINLTLAYKFNSSDEKWIDNGYLCTIDEYKAGKKFNNSVTLPGYIESAQPDSNDNTTTIIAGSVAGAVALLAISIGIGISIPIRKQRRINLLQSKITNKSISSLSGGIAVSMKGPTAVDKANKEVVMLEHHAGENKPNIRPPFPPNNIRGPFPPNMRPPMPPNNIRPPFPPNMRPPFPSNNVRRPLPPNQNQYPNRPAVPGYERGTPRR